NTRTSRAHCVAIGRGGSVTRKHSTTASGRPKLANRAIFIGVQPLFSSTCQLAARPRTLLTTGMTILLVRHGETDGNALRILQRADVPLNQHGMRQATQLPRRPVGHGFVRIVCSDLLRARLTAAPPAS